LNRTAFFEQLVTRARAAGSLLCVGLDPHPEELAGLSGSNLTRLVSFCSRIIDATAGYAAAFKPNSAFFEAYGPEGMAALREVIAAVPEGLPVILDAKRGDIASTAQAYVRAAFEAFGAGALTVNPYLGRDAIQPFLDDPAHGIFLLCKTSNPGAGDLQDQVLAPQGGDPTSFLYERVARLGVSLNQNRNLGLVVGATHPRELEQVRRLAPELWILAPGIGAQGGDLQATLKAGLRDDGLGLLINVSRGISKAADPGAAASDLRDAISRERSAVLEQRAASRASAEKDLPPPMAALADALLKAGCVKFGRFILKSGLESPIYMDLRQLVSDPVLLGQVASAYLPLLNRLTFDRLAALPYAALPIATAISLQSGWPMVYPRKESKAYGTQAEIEGAYAEGERVVIIDDLATTGGSKFEAIEKLTEVGLLVNEVVVLIDRQSGAAETLAKAGYRLHAVFTLSQLLDHWEKRGSVPGEQIAETRAFLARTK
jgi:uridine monophosphate synthetase